MKKLEKLSAFPSNIDSGMTLLDFFANQAIKIAYEQNLKVLGRIDPQCVAENAYDIAEAMVRESERRNKLC